MKKTLVYLLASLVVVMMSVKVYAEIEWSGNIMAGIEKMNYGTATTPSDVKSDNLQFSNIKLNLDVKADLCDKVTAVAQLRSTCEKCNVTKRLVYIEICDLLIPEACIQIGRIELPLGAEVSKKSEGANTMKNPLIFNSLLADDMGAQAVDDGLLISKTLGAVDCKLGITNGIIPAECKDTNGDKAITLNLSGNVPAVEGLTLGGTYYTNDKADVTNETDEITKWIVDVGFTSGLLKLAAALGNEEKKSGVSSITTVDTDYLVLEVVCGNGNTPWWVAARHSTKKPTTSPRIDLEGDVKRLQLGAGYKLCDNAYLKVEYIDNEVKDKKKNLEDYDGIKAIVNVAF